MRARSLATRAGRRRTAAAAVTAAALWLAACGTPGSGPGGGSAGGPGAAPADPGPAAAEPRHGGTLVVAVPVEPPNGFDPHKVEAAAAFEIAVNFFDTLVRASPDGRIVPGLAEWWEVSEDGRTYTFILRDNARFHNGRPVTSRDAAFSLRRILDEATGAPRRADYASIVEIETPDDRTLVLRTADYDAALLANLANLNAAVVPEEAVDTLSNRPVGSGPFRFAAWEPGSRIILERFDDYWDGDLPYLDRVEFRFIDNPATALAALQAGDIHLIPRMTGSDALMLEADPAFKVVSGPQNLVQLMAINNAAEPFDDPRVRQAILHAVDRQAIIAGASWGFGTPIATHMTPVLPFYNPATEQVYPHDPDRARALLREAGYEQGLEAVLTLPEPYSLHIQSGEIIAEQLEAVGIRLRLEVMEWGTWLERVYGDRQFQLTIIGHTGRLDPDALLGRYASDHGSNYFSYNNPQVDRLLVEGRRAVSFDERKRIYDEIQMLITRDAANLFIQDPHVLAGMAAAVEGYKIYPVYVVDLRDVYLAER
ncbi:MAG: ABC transporter substrate-binding protein [Thermaerobacter sp.]